MALRQSHSTPVRSGGRSKATTFLREEWVDLAHSTLQGLQGPSVAAPGAPGVGALHQIEKEVVEEVVEKALQEVDGIRAGLSVS